MNPSAILALISELYVQVAALTEENTQLKNQQAAEQASAEAPSS